MMDQVTAQEIRRHFDVVAEALRGDMRMLAEGIAGTHERLDRVEVRLDGVESRLDRVESRLDRIEIRLTAVETKVDRIEVRVTGIETRLERLDPKGALKRKRASSRSLGDQFRSGPKNRSVTCRRVCSHVPCRIVSSPSTRACSSRGASRVGEDAAEYGGLSR